jgi:hypothetical protein
MAQEEPEREFETPGDALRRIHRTELARSEEVFGVNRWIRESGELEET